MTAAKTIYPYTLPLRSNPAEGVFFVYRAKLIDKYAKNSTGMPGFFLSFASRENILAYPFTTQTYG